jgi:hypothetical protein
MSETIKPVVLTVDEEKRWEEIQAISHEIAYSDRIPTKVDSALCGAVLRARELADELSACRAELEEAKAQQQNRFHDGFAEGMREEAESRLASRDPVPAPYSGWIQRCAQICDECRVLISETKPLEVAKEVAGQLADQIRGLASRESSPDPEGPWAILYEDASRPPEIFFGAGAEEAARKTFEARLTNWSCYLLATAPSPAPDA